MSLDKAIQHGKEKRKGYHGAKAVDTSCRNHGDCPYCQGSRLFSNRKRQEAANQNLNDFLSEESKEI